MELYAAIDLHSNNSVLVVTDPEDHVVFAKRLRNDLELILAALRGCPGAIRAVAVESTYNWYWLVDGLKCAGFDVRLANTAAVKQYDGLKHGGISAMRSIWRSCCGLGSCRRGTSARRSFGPCGT